MAVLVFFYTITWCLIGHNSMSHIIDCSLMECKHRFVNCLPREDCLISCIDTQSCMGAVINCPLTHKCQIECIGIQSCEGITIDATLSSGTLSIFCDNIHEEAADECRGMKVYGSTKKENTGYFNVSCNGFWSSCINSEINCPFNGNCSISCNGDSSCKYAEITGPIHGNLNVNCNGPRSCFEGIINGATSNRLSITGCTEYKSCMDLSLYCPSNTDGHKNCRIEGNDNLGRDTPSMLPTKSPSFVPTTPTINPTIITLTPTSIPTISPSSTPTNKPSLPPSPYPGDGLVIYAVNGWKDIDIHYSGSFGRTHDGKMICGENYGTSCNIASDNWSCRNINEICNNLDATYSIPSIPTNTPSIYPTLSPTSKPPTVTTTKSPTFRPTTNTRIQKPDTTKLHILQQIVQQTPSIDIISVSNDTTDIEMTISNRKNGGFMILGGIGLVVLTCMCVAWAQAHKECTTHSRDDYTSSDDEEYEDYESSQYEDQQEFEDYTENDDDNTELELSTISEEEDEYKENEDEHQKVSDINAATP